MRTFTKALLLVAVLGGMAVGAWYLGPAEDQADGSFARDARAAVAVETAPLTRATIRDLRTFTGTLYAAARFDIAPKIGGRLEQLLVDLGDPVEKNQVVARLDDEEYVQELEQARAELEVARAGLAEAESSREAKERQFERIRELRAQRVASQQELDAAEAEAKAQRARVQVAQAQVAQREAALRAAEVRLGYATIRATWQSDDASRVVGERFVDEGTMISANTAIVSVVDMQHLIAVVFVSERDYPRLSIGQDAVVLTDAYRGGTFPATVARIAPLFREASRQARVELEVPNQDGRLKPGMFVRVRVQLDQKDDALVAPLAAVIERAGETGLFAIDRASGTARFVPVTVGIREGEQAEILEPTLEGEVVTLGHHLLEDGAPIIVGDGQDAPAEGSAQF
jgi:RND family efflux transporter MFP subunit